jgi:CheY-like chemotaxis protein
VGSVSLGRILVIDDNDALRSVARRMLVAAGYDVQEAASGKAALAGLLLHPVDVIITDILMPDMEGLELIRALRQAHPQVKIIAMSGSGGGPEGYLDQALKCGAHQILPKPFTKDSLIAVVNNVLATSRPTDT